MAHHASPLKPLFSRSMGAAMSLAATTAWGANYAPFTVPAGTTFTLNGGDSVTGTGSSAAIRVGNATLNFGPGNIAIGNVDLGVFATNGPAANINFETGSNVTITTVTTTGLGLQSTVNSQASFTLAPSSTVTIRGYQGVNLGHTPFGTASQLRIGDGATLKIEAAPAGGNPWSKGVMTSNNTAITLDAGGRVGRADDRRIVCARRRTGLQPDLPGLVPAAIHLGAGFDAADQHHRTEL